MDSFIIFSVSILFPWIMLSILTVEGQNRIGELLNWRADYLEKSIFSMLKDKTLVEKFYNHPLILELAKKDKEGKALVDKKGKAKRPDYIPIPIFATAAFEVIMNAGKEGADVPVDTMSINQIQKNLKSLGEKNPELAHTVYYLFPNIKSMTKDVDAKIAEYKKKHRGLVQRCNVTDQPLV
jgi:hypothetical protein